MPFESDSKQWDTGDGLLQQGIGLGKLSSGGRARIVSIAHQAQQPLIGIDLILRDSQASLIGADLQVRIGGISRHGYLDCSPTGLDRLGLRPRRSRSTSKPSEEVDLPARRRSHGELVQATRESRYAGGDGSEGALEALALIRRRAIEVCGWQKLCTGARGGRTCLRDACDGRSEIKVLIDRAPDHFGECWIGETIPPPIDRCRSLAFAPSSRCRCGTRRARARDERSLDPPRTR